MSEEREGSAADFAALFSHHARRNDALARILCGLPAEELDPTPGEPDPPSSFDGGAREMAPGPPDPEADHNAFVAALFRQPASGQGGEW